MLYADRDGLFCWSAGSHAESAAGFVVGLSSGKTKDPRRGRALVVATTTGGGCPMKKALSVFFLLATVLGVWTPRCSGQQSTPSDWQTLIKEGKYAEAGKLCTDWLDSSEVAKKAEAHKCLANVALCGKDKEVVTVQPDDVGGGSISSTYRSDAVDQALDHLNQALKLAPQDLSIHQGRLHLLRISSRYDEMTKALDESCETYKGADALTAWIAYSAELFEDRHYQAAIAFLEVLDKRYPDSHEVLGNLGAVYAMLKQVDKAIAFLRRAVELAPNDPIDTWNLGRMYDYAGKIELADRWYQKGLSLQTDPEKRRSGLCIYAEFVEKKLHETERACGLQKVNCPVAQQTACATQK
jgi:tetratricopeptide (TPR) repeat protein